MPPNQRRRRAPGQVRIIAGRWRGRTLPVPPEPDLRPTPDRVRETLFNWLRGRLDGARVLDLFAGTGVLGLEAASRGAEQVILVERNPRAVAAQRAAIERLGAGGVATVQTDVVPWLAAGPGAADRFDVVFMDPPYRAGLYAPAAAALAARGWLRPDASIYIECAAGEPLADLPATWCLSRAKTAGQVRYNLFTAT